jgi:hypothetical protein
VLEKQLLTWCKVCFHSPCSTIRADAGVRKRFCPSATQRAVFTCTKLNKPSVRESLLCWTDLPVTGFYPYPEHTPRNNFFPEPSLFRGGYAPGPPGHARALPPARGRKNFFLADPPSGPPIAYENYSSHKESGPDLPAGEEKKFFWHLSGGCGVNPCSIGGAFRRGTTTSSGAPPESNALLHLVLVSSMRMS